MLRTTNHQFGANARLSPVRPAHSSGADSEEQHPQLGAMSTVAQPISDERCKIVAVLNYIVFPKMI